MSISNSLKNKKELPVAILSDGKTVLWQQFISHISAYQSDIENEFGCGAENKLAIYFEDSYQFLTTFCAILISGNSVVMPGNNLKGTCANLTDYVDGFIGDFDNEIVSELKVKHIKPISIANVELLSDEFVVPVISSDKPLVSLFTSGSSGAPKLIEKSLRQLEVEVNSLDQLWGDKISDSIIVGSVSHQHIYGLLFRILWPLLSGRTLYAEILTYPEEMHGVLKSFESSILVSSPTQLSRLPDSIEWNLLRGKIKAVFSSGAPLEKQSSLHARDSFGVGVIEVLGSTETGGIAYKCEDGVNPASWTAFPEVVVSRDETTGAMQLISPRLPDNELYTTTDKIKFTEDEKGFVLLGRTDRIVKIEGKRLSLDEMEAVLLEHPFINSCRIITFTEARQVIAVAATLTSKGKDYFVDKGKFKLNRELVSFLRGSFENVLMPRKWRYIDEIPVNAQGKLEHEKIRELFIDVEKPKFPEVIGANVDADNASLQIYVPDNIYYFAGHFPGTSILAGVVQLTWAAHYAKQYFDIEINSKQLDAIKFQNVITPGANITLDLKYNRDKSNVAFKYYSKEKQSEEIQYSSGRIKLEL